MVVWIVRLIVDHLTSRHMTSDYVVNGARPCHFPPKQIPPFQNE